MANKSVDDFLMDAKEVMFIKPSENNGIAAVFIIFEDFNTAIALYSELERVNKTNPQYLGFKKSHSSIILSIILENTQRAHAKMLLDYNEKEFEDFISVVKPTDDYIILFGKIVDGQKQIGGFQDSPVVCGQYRLE